MLKAPAGVILKEKYVFREEKDMNYYETEKVNDNLTMIRSLTVALLFLLAVEADAVFVVTYLVCC